MIHQGLAAWFKGQIYNLVQQPSLCESVGFCWAETLRCFAWIAPQTHVGMVGGVAFKDLFFLGIFTYPKLGKQWNLLWDKCFSTGSCTKAPTIRLLPPPLNHLKTNGIGRRLKSTKKHRGSSPNFTGNKLVTRFSWKTPGDQTIQIYGNFVWSPL